MKKKHVEHRECCCGHHSHGGCSCGCEREDKKQQSKTAFVLKYGIGAVPVIIGFLQFIPYNIPTVASVAAYLIFGFEVYREMVKNLLSGRVFTEFTLMCVATAGAFAIDATADAAALMYLYSLGERLSSLAYSRSRKRISELIEISPEYANVLVDGQTVKTRAQDVAVGSFVIVRAGERVPVDGIVIDGGGYADVSPLTGESSPLALYEGVSCPSGAMLSDGSVTLLTQNEYGNSVAEKMKRAVRDAESRSSVTERKISRFAAVFTPIAFLTAFCIFLFGTLITKNAQGCLRAAITLLVVSCPCSLVLSVPLTYFAGVGRAASMGMIFRGGEVIDRMARLDTVAFDKTGTLTESELALDSVKMMTDMPQKSFLTLARAVLEHSSHPTALAFCSAVAEKGTFRVENVKNISGLGIVCDVDGKQAVFGNERLMREYGMEADISEYTSIYGAYDGAICARIDFSSKIKDGAVDTVKGLRELGVRRIAMISGDTPSAVFDTCSRIGISEYYASTSPDQKLSVFDGIAESKGHSGFAAYCGDGLNDSAVIVASDVGIAMGRCGSALTVLNADLVLMDDDPRKICTAIKISRKTARIADQNIALSLGIKLAVTLLGVAFVLLNIKMPIELAVIADVGATLLAVLNSLRAAR